MDDQGEDRVRCEKCGWLHRSGDACGKYVLTDVTAKDMSLCSSDRLRYHLRQRVEICKNSGQSVRVQRLIDKNSDVYFERVTDLETGQVIHECSEPLSQHRGRGTAKPKT